MNANELKYHVEKTGSNFFSRESMRFFGDTMKNYGVRQTTIETYTNGFVKVYELYRKQSVKFGLITSSYFNCATFEREFSKRE